MNDCCTTTHTHTHLYVCMCVCVCKQDLVLNTLQELICPKILTNQPINIQNTKINTYTNY